MAKKEKDIAYRKEEEQEHLETLWRLRDETMWQEEMRPEIQRKIGNEEVLSRSDEMNINRYGDFGERKKFFAKTNGNNNSNSVSSDLRISQPGDEHEKEADAIAKKVTSGENASTANSNSEGVSRKEDGSELMRKSDEGEMHGTEELQQNLNASKGGGQSLDDSTKSEMESKMGADLSDVKIHTRSNAHEMSEGINAKAFTHGQDIYFKDGNYNPGSVEGKELLAHELVHTQQQGSGEVQPKIQRVVDWTVGMDMTKPLDEKITKEIDDNRNAVPIKNGLVKEGKGYRYYADKTAKANFDKMTPAAVTKEKNTFKKKVDNAVWKELKSEGSISSINAYDDQLVTWGKGISGKSFMDDILKHLAKDSGIKQQMIDVGLFYNENGVVIVDTTSGDDYGKIKGRLGKKTSEFTYPQLELMQKDKRLLSFLINLSEAEGTRQNVLDAQFEVVQQHAGKVPDYVYELKGDTGNFKDSWDEKGVALASHLSHWQTAVSWEYTANSYAATKGDHLKILVQFILYEKLKVSKSFNDGKRFSTQPNGAIVFKYDNPAVHLEAIGSGGDSPGFVNEELESKAYKCSSVIVEAYPKAIPSVADYIFMPNEDKSFYYVLPSTVEASVDTVKSTFSQFADTVDKDQSAYKTTYESFKDYTATKFIKDKYFSKDYSWSTAKSLYDLLTDSKKGTAYQQDVGTSANNVKFAMRVAALLGVNEVTSQKEFDALKKKAGKGYKDEKEKLGNIRTEGATILNDPDFQKLSGDDKKYIESFLKDPATEKKAPGVHKKSLDINQPGDPYEKEADDIAKKITSGENTSVTSSNTENISRKEESAELMRKDGDGEMQGTGELQQNLDASKGSGQSLDDSIKDEMESKMGADLSDVKIHTGSNANEMSEGINAKAFTHGQDIYFKDGQYNPGSGVGKELLAHELVHTQQQANGVGRKIQRFDGGDVAVVKDGDNIKVTLTYTEGTTQKSKEKTIAIKTSRDFLVKNYNWNAIIHIMKFLDAEYNDPDNFSYTYPTAIKGNLEDDKIIIPDEGIKYLIKRQAKNATDDKTVTSANADAILKKIDGIAGNGFAAIMGYADMNALRDESTNTSTTDTNSQEIPALDFSKDEATLYDTLRSLVIARNGLWSDESKIVNMVSIRRKVGTSEVNNATSEYNDTISICWKETPASGEVIKHTKYFMATTTSSAMNSFRNLVPQTLEVIPGTHWSKATVFRSQRFMTDQNGTKKFDVGATNGVNIHMGYDDFSGWGKHNMSASIPEAYKIIDLNEEEDFQAWLIMARCIGLIHKWQLKDSILGYNTLVELDKGKVEYVDKDSTNINVKKDTTNKAIDIATARTGTIAAWTTKGKIDRKQLSAILTFVDASFKEPDGYAKMDQAAIEALFTDDRMAEIVKQQAKYAIQLSEVHGVAGSGFSDIMNGNYTEITDATITDAKADKKVFDDMMTKSKDYPDFSDSLRTYIKGIKGTLSAEKQYMKKKDPVDKKDALPKSTDNAPISDKDVGGWSENCQVILGNGEYYKFQMQSLQFANETGQRRWYYTLIDGSSIKAPEVKQGDVKGTENTTPTNNTAPTNNATPPNNTAPTNTIQPGNTNTPVNTNQNNQQVNSNPNQNNQQVNPNQHNPPGNNSVIPRKKDASINDSGNLSISQPGDTHEKEADDIAKQVVNGNENIQRKSNGIMRFPSVDRKEADEIFTSKHPWAKNSSPQDLLRKADDGEMQTTENFDSQLNSSKGGGQSINDSTKVEMESKMGADLSDVKIHTGSNAHEMSEGINAKAFTHGQDIYFKDGNYNPGSSEGKELLAHELVHTQQQQGGVQRKIQRKYETDEEVIAAIKKEKTDGSFPTVQTIVAKLEPYVIQRPEVVISAMALWDAKTQSMIAVGLIYVTDEKKYLGGVQKYLLDFLIATAGSAYKNIPSVLNASTASTTATERKTKLDGVASGDYAAVKGVIDAYTDVIFLGVDILNILNDRAASTDSKKKYSVEFINNIFKAIGEKDASWQKLVAIGVVGVMSDKTMSETEPEILQLFNAQIPDTLPTLKEKITTITTGARGHKAGVDEDYTKGTVRTEGKTYLMASSTMTTYKYEAKLKLYFNKGDKVELVSTDAEKFNVEVKGTAHYDDGKVTKDIAAQGWIRRTDTDMTLGVFKNIGVIDRTKKTSGADLKKKNAKKEYVLQGEDAGLGKLGTENPMNNVKAVMMHYTAGAKNTSLENEYRNTVNEGGHKGAQYSITTEGNIELVVPINEVVGHYRANKDTVICNKPKDASKVEMDKVRVALENKYKTVSVQMIPLQLKDYLKALSDQGLYDYFIEINGKDATVWNLYPDLGSVADNTKAIGIEMVGAPHVMYERVPFSKDDTYSVANMTAIVNSLDQLVNDGSITDAQRRTTLRLNDKAAIDKDKKTYPDDASRNAAKEDIDEAVFASLKNNSWKIGNTGYKVMKKDLSPGQHYKDVNETEKKDFLTKVQALNLPPALKEQVWKGEERTRIKNEIDAATKANDDAKVKSLNAELEKMNADLYDKLIEPNSFMVYVDMPGSQKYALWLLCFNLSKQFNLDLKTQFVGHNDIDSKGFGEGQVQAEFIRTMADYREKVLEVQKLKKTGFDTDIQIIQTLDAGTPKDPTATEFFNNFYFRVADFNTRYNKAMK